MQLHPSLILIAGAVAVGILPGRLRKVAFLAAPAVSVLAVLALRPGTTWAWPFLESQLSPLRVDELSLVFGLIFTLLAFFGGLYALHIERPGEHVAALLYAAGSLGVVFAGDWLSLFVFWELMAASSVFLIWYRGTSRSLESGFRYIMIHFLGGNLLLFGIILYIAGGSLDVVSLTGTNGAAFWLILLGVAINAAIPPLHAWLTDSYPEATLTGSVFLSGFTTKVAVYVLVRVFPGTTILLWLGVAMTLYGVIYAILENDIRRLLSYHIISQVGFMVAGVGLGSALALNGAVAHAFSHILYKALLFMGAGAVIQATGREKLTDLGGLARLMPAAVTLYLIGGFSISGVPLLNGFISKSIVVSAASVDGFPIAELLLVLASAGTFLSTTLKLPYFAFLGKDRGLQPTRLPVNMYLGMGGLALLCLFYGLFPGFLYARLPYAMDFVPYTVEHVIQVVQLLIATAVAFFLLLPKLGGQPTISLDFDWFYRRPLATLLRYVVRVVKGAETRLEERAASRFETVRPYIDNPFLAPARLSRAAPFGGRGGRAGEEREVVEPHPYDENRYRLPAGLTILLTIVLLGVALAAILVRQG